MTAAVARPFFASPWPTLLLVGALWLLTVNQLRVEWSINPQYAYGWAVPLLAAYLFAERWRDRPPPAPGRAPGLLAGLVVLLAAALLPLRLIQEATPDWRALGWALALTALLLTLAGVWFCGGRPWLAHFAFPLVFFLVAVPWPMPFEQAVVQQLMRGVAALCVETFGWFGQPAVQAGNVIEIARGKVGVEEACSGVRSLQTMFMGGLFLGELFRLSLARRTLLVAAVIVFAFVCNVGRALALMTLTARSGPAAATAWHDAIGHTALALSLAALLGLAVWLRGRAVPPAAAVVRPPGRLLPRGVIIAGAAWLLAVEVGNEAWYRGHERGRTALPSWSVTWPAEAVALRELPFSDNVRSMLRFSTGRSAAWKDAAGSQWSAFFIRWEPGRSSAQLARSHGPELCLTASGAILREDYGLRPLRVRDLELPFRAYLFSVKEMPMYVFYCLWEDRSTTDAPASTRVAMTSSSRLEDVRRGHRNRGQQVLELAVAGPRTPAEAERAVAALLESIVQ